MLRGIRTKTALLVGDAISMIDSYYVDPLTPISWLSQQ